MKLAVSPFVFGIAVGILGTWAYRKVRPKVS